MRTQGGGELEEVWSPEEVWRSVRTDSPPLNFPVSSRPSVRPPVLSVRRGRTQGRSRLSANAGSWCRGNDSRYSVSTTCSSSTHRRPGTYPTVGPGHDEREEGWSPQETTDSRLFPRTPRPSRTSYPRPTQGPSVPPPTPSKCLRRRGKGREGTLGRGHRGVR